MPDVYQGDELLCLSLVDPDNRRPVDWDARRAALADPPPKLALIRARAGAARAAAGGVRGRLRAARGRARTPCAFVRGGDGRWPCAWLRGDGATRRRCPPGEWRDVLRAHAHGKLSVADLCGAPAIALLALT